MTKYIVTIHFPTGDMELEEIYDTEEDAEEAACIAISAWNQGCEDLHNLNPGDYDYDEDDIDDVDYDIDEVDV